MKAVGTDELEALGSLLEAMKAQSDRAHDLALANQVALRHLRKRVEVLEGGTTEIDLRNERFSHGPK